jgi:hypothetical protein
LQGVVFVGWADEEVDEAVEFEVPFKEAEDVRDPPERTS